MKKIEKVSFLRDPGLEGLEVCRVVDSSHIFPNHAHDGIYAIGLMERGGSVELSAGPRLFCPKSWRIGYPWKT